MLIVERLLSGNEVRVVYNYARGTTLIHITEEQYTTILTLIHGLQLKKHDLVKAYWFTPSPEILNKISILAIARRLFTLESMYQLSIITNRNKNKYFIFYNTIAMETLITAYSLRGKKGLVISTLTYGKEPSVFPDDKFSEKNIVDITYEISAQEYNFLEYIAEKYELEDEYLDIKMRELGLSDVWFAVRVVSLESNEQSPRAARSPAN